MKKLRKFFAQFDMFAAPPTLRAKQQPQTSSLCSGVISFLLAAFFSYVFIINVVAVMKFDKIDSVQTESRLAYDHTTAKSVFFGIRVGYLPVQISEKYFDVGYFIIHEDGSNRTYQLQQCRPDQWKQLGDDYTTQFQKFVLQDFYCPLPTDIISLKKVYYAPNSQYAMLFVRPCNNSMRVTCEIQSDQKQFISALSAVEGAIFISVYFMDEAINPNSRIPIDYFTNTDTQFAFTTKRGIIATIELGSYRVQTDMSVLPVQEIEVRQGNFLHSFRETSIELINPEDNFATIYISMNRKHILVERKVGKLDEMLSYAGGLFSIIIGFLSLFLFSFNQYRYELMVAEGIFHEDEQGNYVRENDFTFYKYIKFTIFDWIHTLFCVQLKWEDCQIIESTRDQSNKQIDVTRLFRKIQAIELAISHLMSKHQKDSLALLKPNSLNVVKRNRLIQQYYDVIIDGKSSSTFEEYRISKQILKFSLALIKNDPVSRNNQVLNLETSSYEGHEIYQEQQIQIDYQSLSRPNYLQFVVQNKFKDIATDIDKLKIDNQYEQIEIELAEGLFGLKKQIKQKFMREIPIRILYRLARIYSRSPGREYENQKVYVKKKKRITLSLQKLAVNGSQQDLGLPERSFMTGEFKKQSDSQNRSMHVE